MRIKVRIYDSGQRMLLIDGKRCCFSPGRLAEAYESLIGKDANGKSEEDIVDEICQFLIDNDKVNEYVKID